MGVSENRGPLHVFFSWFPFASIQTSNMPNRGPIPILRHTHMGVRLKLQNPSMKVSGFLDPDWVDLCLRPLCKWVWRVAPIGSCRFNVGSNCILSACQQ